MRYEDLVDKPTESFGAIARHLLMTPEPAQLEKAIAMANFDTLRDKEAAAGFVEKPETSAEPFFRVGKPGQWRDVLSPIQVDRVVSAHRAMMSKFKYLPD